MGEVATLLRGWVWEPVPVVGLLLVGLAYLLAARAVRRSRSGPPWPAARTACFLAGTLTAAVAVLGPPGAFDDTFFYAHMVQHILLTMVAVPLLVLGDPVLLTLRVAPRAVRRRWLLPVYRSTVLARLLRPVVGWLAFTAVLVLSHLPAVYDFAVTHPLVHQYVEHPVYVGTALLYFYPLLAPHPGPHQVPGGVGVLSMLTMMVPASITGFFIYAAPHPLYPFYAHVARPFAPGPLADQQLSGALMWSTAMALTAVWVCVVGARFLRDEEARGRRVDRAAGAVVPPAAGPAQQGWST